MSRKKVKSLREKLTFRVILIALAILMVAVISSQMSSNTSFWKTTEESITLSTSIATRDINNIFNEAATLLSATANEIKFLPYNDMQIMQSYLKNARTPYPYVSEIYMGIAETNQYADGGGYVQPPGWVLTQRPYYIGAMSTEGIFYQDPYLSSTGEIFSSIAVKLKDENGAAIGVVVLDLALETLLDFCGKSTIPGTTATGFLLDSKKQILAHRNNAFMPRVENGEAVYSDYDSIGVQESKTIMEGLGGEPSLKKAIDYDNVEKYVCTAVLPGSGWTFGFAVPVRDFAARQNTASSVVMYLVIIAIAIVAIFFASQFLLIRPIKPISDIIDTAKMLAIGKTPSPLKIAADDELGLLADDFNKFIVSTQEQVSVLGKMADGDFTSKVTPKSQDDLLSNTINRLAENIQGLIRSIHGASLHVATSAVNISQESLSLEQNTIEQAEAINRLGSSLTTITEKTRGNAEMADKAAVLAKDILVNAQKGTGQMDQMILAVQQIEEASQSINIVIKTIDDIAFQTNILALNAAVEAARAGQHGKGFAVVADEVRSLAAKSAGAAKETSELIANSIEKSNLGARIAAETASSFTEIVNGINESTKIAGDIAASSYEQSQSIDQINTGIAQVSNIIQHNSATSGETASAASEMKQQSDTLETLVSRFKVKDAV
ncbi:MAG: methyl-accepting chemotaxis protein [Oscillospiraceae bacterium]|nr:methyl-accepting chemotaxis protein [Oscillospiraceae bacterium]